MLGVDRVELDLLLLGESSKEGMQLAIAFVIFHAVDRMQGHHRSGSTNVVTRCRVTQPARRVLSPPLR